MAQLKAKEEKKGEEDKGAKGGDPFRGMGPQIKLPHFREDKDNLDAFLLRFEGVANTQKWP